MFTLVEATIITLVQMLATVGELGGDKAGLVLGEEAVHGPVVQGEMGEIHGGDMATKFGQEDQTATVATTIAAAEATTVKATTVKATKKETTKTKTTKEKKNKNAKEEN